MPIIKQPIEYLEFTTGPEPTYTIIWLHGLGGATQDEFIAFASSFQLSTDCRFIFPQAPLRSITCHQGQIMRGWYDIVSFERLEASADVEGILTSREALDTLIEKEHIKGTPTEKIFVGGFSQGGAMTYMTGLTFPKTLAGLVVLSAYIPAESQLRTNYQLANSKTPLFIGHGDFDDIAPLELGQIGHQIIKSLGNPCTYHTYPMQHDICLPEITAISRWLNDLMCD